MTGLPSRLVTIDIDGLRRDVFLSAIEAGQAPNLARLLGGPDAAAGLHLDPVSNAPSITFSCQTSIFTGAHPREHGIVGNQFFDRFGRTNGGIPRYYAFDVGDSLAVDDAVRVFTGPIGLVSQTLPDSVPTLYERASERRLSSTVVNHMLARGASTWLTPGLVDIARFTKGGRLFGISAAAFDRHMIERTLAHLRAGARPDLLTVYFLGLDKHSHEHGPGAQLEYLSGTVDPLIGRLVGGLEASGLMAGALFAILSDHGQIDVVADDLHSLRLSFPFDREMGYLFDTLGLDVHDVPGEGPNCNAVVGCNGGSAAVYIQNRTAHWGDPPRYELDVAPVARAFWEANATGRYARDLHHALDLILTRNVERDGWWADYEVWLPGDSSIGATQPLPDYIALRPDHTYVEPLQRIRAMTAPVAGDILLLSNYADGYYFGKPSRGTHGGLHRDDSEAVLAFGYPSGSTADIERLREAILAAVTDRCRAESRRVGIVDFVPAVAAALGW